MQPIRNYIHIKVDKQYNDEILLDNGGKLFIDPTWNPQEHVSICGEVVATPIAGVSIYSLECKGIVPEVQIGDRVYFNFNTLLTESNRLKDDIWMVAYDQVFCAERNGELIAIGGWILVEPFIETLDEKNGSLFIPEMAQKKEWQTKGILKHIGTPKTDQPQLPVKAGDIIYFDKWCCFKNKIAGKEYFCMEQADIILYEPNNQTKNL
jgi:co-chaperonin GroES (HSP10)